MLLLLSSCSRISSVFYSITLCLFIFFLLRFGCRSRAYTANGKEWERTLPVNVYACVKFLISFYAFFVYAPCVDFVCALFFLFCFDGLFSILSCYFFVAFFFFFILLRSPSIRPWWICFFFVVVVFFCSWSFFIFIYFVMFFFRWILYDSRRWVVIIVVAAATAACFFLGLFHVEYVNGSIYIYFSQFYFSVVAVIGFFFVFVPFIPFDSFALFPIPLLLFLFCFSRVCLIRSSHLNCCACWWFGPLLWKCEKNMPKNDDEWCVLSIGEPRNPKPPLYANTLETAPNKWLLWGFFSCISKPRLPQFLPFYLISWRPRQPYNFQCVSNTAKIEAKVRRNNSQWRKKMSERRLSTIHNWRGKTIHWRTNVNYPMHCVLTQPAKRNQIRCWLLLLFSSLILIKLSRAYKSLARFLISFCTLMVRIHCAVLFHLSTSCGK